MKVKPIGDRILVKQSTQEEVTASGIVLPANEKEKKAQGKIVALGNGEGIQRLGLKEGDTVVFGKYSGDEIEMDGEDYKILFVGSEKDNSDVLAIIE